MKNQLTASLAVLALLAATALAHDTWVQTNTNIVCPPPSTRFSAALGCGPA